MIFSAGYFRQGIIIFFIFGTDRGLPVKAPVNFHSMTQSFRNKTESERQRALPGSLKKLCGDNTSEKIAEEHHETLPSAYEKKWVERLL